MPACLFLRAALLIQACAVFIILAAPAHARVCKYRELTDLAGQRVTMSAKVDMVEPDEDDPAKRVYITLDNSAADHCYVFLAGVPRSAAATCREGRRVTATGKVAERFDAWWGLEKISAIRCD